MNRVLLFVALVLTLIATILFFLGEPNGHGLLAAGVASYIGSHLA